MIWCEWDIGADSLLFSSEENAYSWAENNGILKEALEDETLEDLWNDLIDCRN